MCLLLNRVDDVFCLMPETERRDGGWGRVELKAVVWWHCERGLERMGLLILNRECEDGGWGRVELNVARTPPVVRPLQV